MKHILFLLLFLPVLAYAQFPANPNKIRLGNQTTADGLVVRTAAAPSWTPSSINNAWLAFDTVAAVLYYYDAATWNTFSSGSGGNVTGVSLSNDTLYITTPDSTFSQLLRNFANSNLTFTGNRVHNLSTRTLTIADGGTYPTYQQSSATDGITIASSATDLIAQTPGLLQIENSDTITITADRIRMNAADTRIQQVAKDNALNRLVALDSLTGQLKYVDKSSISSGGTVTGTGTTGTIPVWSSSSALGDSPLTVSSGSVIAGGTGFFRFPVGTTAQRPGTPAAGMTRYNSTLGNLDFYGASAWENPAKSAYGSGLYTATRIPFADANGRLTDASALTWNGAQLGILPTAIPNTNTFVAGGNATTTGTGQNTAIGSSALASVTTGFNNAMFGRAAGTFITTGYENVAVGTEALSFMQTGNGNAGIGIFAGRRANNAARNVYIGTLAGHTHRTGSYNVFIGGESGPQSWPADSMTGNYNVIIGAQNAQNIKNVSGNVVIGNQLSLPVGTNNNQLVISNLIFGTGANGTGTSIPAGGKVGIKVAAPAQDFHVQGTARITGSDGTGTHIMLRDADGDISNATLGSGLSLTGGTLSATGAGGTVTSVGITAPAAGITVSGSPVTSSGSMTLALADDLAAVEGLSASGIATRTASNTWTARTIVAGAGIAVTNGDGVSGNPTISRTYSLTQITISGGSTFFGTTPERPDNDTGGSVTVSTVGSDFGVSGSTLDYTGASGALLRVEGSVSFSVADDGDYYLSIFKEGTEIAATSTRISCVAGNYYTIGLPATTTSGTTNDTFDVRIATVTGNSTTTMHRCGFIIERVY